MQEPQPRPVSERVVEELHRGKDQRSAAADDLAMQMRKLQDDFAAIKDAIAQIAGAEAREAASRIGAAAKDAAGAFAEGAKHDSQAILADLEAYARKNPHYALGAALGLGLFFGLMLRRR